MGEIILIGCATLGLIWFIYAEVKKINGLIYFGGLSALLWIVIKSLG